MPYIEISIEPGDPTLETFDPTKLTFTYDAAFEDHRTIKIKVYFDFPVYISAGQKEDILVIKFQGPIYDMQDNLELTDTSKVIRKPLPPQVELGMVTETIEVSANAVQSGSIFMCAGNAVTNFLLAGSLNQLWGMINNLQIVIHSPLINV